MARVAVDMWGSSIVAFSGRSCTELSARNAKRLTAEIGEN
jgi:hypothetical protein